MVRLREIKVMSLIRKAKFQFQYGTIKSVYFILTSLTTFQFQYGTIKSRNN